MRNFFCYYVKNLLWIYLCIMLCFGYMLIVDLIPEHIYMTKGGKLKWNNTIPVNIVIQNKNKDYDTTAVFQELDYGEYTAECFLLGVIPIKQVHISVVDKTSVYASGKIIGVYGKTKGVLVTGVSRVLDESGEMVTPGKSVVEMGDYIISVNGNPITKKEQLLDYVRSSNGETMSLEILHKGETLTSEIEPAKTKKGEYLLGLWVKDDLAGIGTLTYFTTDQQFGALGHGISDGNTGNLMELSDGCIYDATILDIEKSSTGHPGKIQGAVKYSKSNKYGEVESNSNIGIYGELDNEDFLKFSNDSILLEIMHKQDVELGEAEIISEIDGTTRNYDIEIVSVNYDPKNENKQIMFKVTDESLFEKTGGIVQGMSGSPIVQDGKILGAVTHVFIEDPTKGYGIFIENMMQ